VIFSFKHHPRLTGLRRVLTIAPFGVLFMITGCSVFEGDKIDYKSASSVKAPTLDVPPDLSQLNKDGRYTVPGQPVSANAYAAAGGKKASVSGTAPLQLGDVRIERAGNQRWLVIDRPAEKVWEPTKEFWQENGFLLATDQQDVGIMETDWAENRAKLPMDFIRKSLGKLFDNLYSTGERDKFRTRIERNSAGGSEIFISHRGMVEVYKDNMTQTIWQPRNPDPELETEFLRRLMIKLGVSQEQAKTLVAANQLKTLSRLVTLDNQPTLQIDEGFDRAWRRVGLTLDRTGFTVEDRDRASGLYFVRYVEPNPDKKEPGFFAKLFGAKAKVSTPQKHRISLLSQGNATRVEVLNNDGNPEVAQLAQRILKVLAEDLK
jgi:outer membrane protein assembly factor BamC